MFRPAQQSLVAGCEHRHFNVNCTDYATTLQSQANNIKRQVDDAISAATLNYGRVHCLRFGNLKSMVKAIHFK